MKRKDEELASLKKQAKGTEQGTECPVSPASLSSDGDTDSSDDHGGSGNGRGPPLKSEPCDPINVG